MWILKVFYDGEGYSGFQVQPNRPTIQGVLEKTLRDLGYLGNTHIKFCCRTDAGVSAISQLIGLDVDEEPKIRAINAGLPRQIRVWALSKNSVEAPLRRLVKSKQYRYYYYPARSIDVDRAGEILRMLVGRREFGGLVKGERKDCGLSSIRISKHGDFLILDFHGTYFRWQFVRRAVSLITGYGRGEIDLRQVNEILEGKHGIKPAPPEPLYLIDVLADLDFRIDPYSLKQAITYLSEKASISAAKYASSGDAASTLRTYCKGLSRP